MYGDVDTVGALAFLHGGNDSLDNLRSVNVNSTAIGDVFVLSGGTVNAGNDTIRIRPTAMVTFRTSPRAR